MKLPSGCPAYVRKGRGGGQEGLSKLPLPVGPLLRPVPSHPPPIRATGQETQTWQGQTSRNDMEGMVTSPGPPL